MTPLQQRFVEAYRISRNAKQAAITAGYAPDSAAAIGSRCLRKPQIVAALAKIGVRIAYGVHPRDQQRKPRSAFVKRGLTLKQQRFVEQYLIDGNATQAAIRARLPSRSPSCAGARMLRRPGVAEAIRAARAASAARSGVSIDWLLIEWGSIAFADIGSLVTWGPDGIKLRPNAEIARDQYAALGLISLRRDEKGTTLSLRLGKKVAALERLDRFFGLDRRATSPVATPISDVVGKAAAATERIAANDGAVIARAQRPTWPKLGAKRPSMRRSALFPRHGGGGRGRYDTLRARTDLSAVRQNG